jgi:enoyl-CoA hydratase/carnithine racemase
VTASMIDVVRQGPIAIVTLRRPPANAMSLELTDEIAGVFQGLGQGRSVRSVVLTGQGKSFCAGVDLKTVPNFDEVHQRRMVDALNRAFYAVYSCPVPVVVSHCRVARISGVDVIPDTHARFEPGPASSIASKIHP